MTRPLVCMWILVLAAAGLAAGLSWSAAAAGRERMDREVAELAALRGQALALAQLRAGLPAWADAPPPPPEGLLAARVADALAAAGLPPTALSGLSPEAELRGGRGTGGAAGRGGGDAPRVRRRGATLTLEGVSLPQVGAFLAAWREREPAWTITRVDLSPPHAGARGARADAAAGARHGGGGGDLPLRATLNLESVYLERPAHWGPPGGPAHAGGGG